MRIIVVAPADKKDAVNQIMRTHYDPNNDSLVIPLSDKNGDITHYWCGSVVKQSLARVLIPAVSQAGAVVYNRDINTPSSVLKELGLSPTFGSQPEKVAEHLSKRIERETKRSEDVAKKAEARKSKAKTKASTDESESEKSDKS